MAEVSLRDVRKSYGDTAVIHGVDCAIADGEFLVVVGPSGCGKSTLLRMIAGLEVITGGEVSIGDRVVNELEPAERDIAMVFQNYALYPHMTVFDNMAYGLKIRKIPKAEIDTRVRKAAAILELDDDMLRRKPRQLSGGQRQRVAMGRAIVREPSVFLFDEPLSNLDAKLRVQMRIEIKKLQETLGITSVYVTHDQVEAMTLGHRLLVLNAGNVEQLGTPITLYERPASTFVAGFIGSPAMNLMPAAIGVDGASVALPGGVAFTLAFGAQNGEPGRPVTLGVRPEHFEVDDSGAITLTVTLVEQLGADTIVHGALGADEFDVTIRMRGVVTIAPGEKLSLTVPSEHIHVFDRETGKRLG
ncbi:MAG: sn-glycerol-3-phosphate ABC transporter ATP-binding protein UgpC [Alphaproteobacteria bacterium]|nr:sn-glycerol-3-phosphate ABC transporter ATP-binding protein UgpC [Alphaproteobacteria bacterium]